MRQIIILMTLVSFSLMAGSVQAQEANKELTGTIKVQVDGLSCPFCAYGLEKKLKKMEGVEKIEINVQEAYALLTIEEGKSVSEEVIRENVKDAGFTAREINEVTSDE